MSRRRAACMLRLQHRAVPMQSGQSAW